MTELITISEAEARAITERIKQSLTEARCLLLEMYEREGWKALGYESWREYGQVEFGYSESRIYQLMDAAKVERNISTMVEKSIPERHLRPLTRLEPEQQSAAYQQAVETAPNGKVTAAHVEEVAKQFKPAGDKQARVSYQDIDDGWGNYDEDDGLAVRIEATTPETAPKLAIHFSSNTPEHYTPQNIIDAVVEFFGEIDLDPCADPGHHIPAKMHYEEKDNGLIKPWHGKVYMNPPYGREIEQWVRRLTYFHEQGQVTEAIALLPARVDTQWWQLIRDYYVCFVTGRLTFIGNDDPAPFPSAIVYLGLDVEWFYRVFQKHHQLGDIWGRIKF